MVDRNIFRDIDSGEFEGGIVGPRPFAGTTEIKENGDSTKKTLIRQTVRKKSRQPISKTELVRASEVLGIKDEITEFKEKEKGRIKEKRILRKAKEGLVKESVKKKKAKKTKFKKAIRKEKKIIKAIQKPFKGIRIKKGPPRITITLDDIAKASRKTILSPTVFQLKMQQNIQKKRKPVSFFSKGRI